MKLALVIMVVGFIFFYKGFDWKGLLDFKQSDEYTGTYIYFEDRETGQSLVERNADAKAYPASLTKMMTTIVALEHIEDLSASAPVDIDTYREMVAQNASMAGFYGKEAVTYRDLLYGTVLNSGGEAANSLAIHVAGSTVEFVQMMNEKAEALGLDGTHFTNPEGLHDKKQYTTARDMAKLLDYALNNNDFRAIFTKATFTTTATLDHPEGVTLKSTVLMALDPAEQRGFQIIGGKSGTTYEAGQCWATLGVVADREYISIVMGAPLENVSHPDFAQKRDTLKLFSKVAGGSLN